MASDVLKAAMCCNVVRLVPLDSRFPPAQQQLRLDADVNTALSLPVISWSNELRVAQDAALMRLLVNACEIPPTTVTGTALRRCVSF